MEARTHCCHQGNYPPFELKLPGAVDNQCKRQHCARRDEQHRGAVHHRRKPSCKRHSEGVGDGETERGPYDGELRPERAREVTEMGRPEQDHNTDKSERDTYRTVRGEPLTTGNQTGEQEGKDGYRAYQDGGEAGWNLHLAPTQ